MDMENLEESTKKEVGELNKVEETTKKELDELNKVEESTKKELDELNKKELDDFDRLIEKNKASGKSWYHGLKGRWWWGMTEVQVRQKIESGLLTNRHKIAITSIVRNEEQSGNLKRFLDCCEMLEQYHKDIVYIFIEGDSSDNTYNILLEWLKPRKDYILKKIDRKMPCFSKDKSSKRTVYFAELRNILVDLALSIPDITEVLMIDANYGWKGDLISSLRKINADIVAPLAVMHKDRNGKYLFYDVWAFRKDGKHFSHYYPYIKGIEFDKPIRIDSAGGGYLIKRNVLDARVRYNGDKDCEHAIFCRRARKKGFTIKINPKTYIRKSGF
jgi:hypothetical protein